MPVIPSEMRPQSGDKGWIIKAGLGIDYTMGYLGPFLEQNSSGGIMLVVRGLHKAYDFVGDRFVPTEEERSESKSGGKLEHIAAVLVEGSIRGLAEGIKGNEQKCIDSVLDNYHGTIDDQARLMNTFYSAWCLNDENVATTYKTKFTGISENSGDIKVFDFLEKGVLVGEADPGLNEKYAQAHNRYSNFFIDRAICVIQQKHMKYKARKFVQQVLSQ